MTRKLIANEPPWPITVVVFGAMMFVLFGGLGNYIGSEVQVQKQAAEAVVDTAAESLFAVSHQKPDEIKFGESSPALWWEDYGFLVANYSNPDTARRHARHVNGRVREYAMLVSQYNPHTGEIVFWRYENVGFSVWRPRDK